MVTQYGHEFISGGQRFARAEEINHLRSKL